MPKKKPKSDWGKRFRKIYGITWQGEMYLDVDKKTKVARYKRRYPDGNPEYKEMIKFIAKEKEKSYELGLKDRGKKKKCSQCKKVKDISDFHKDANKLDGHKYYCKDCNRKYIRANYYKHSEKILKTHRQRYRDNKPEWNEKTQRYKERYPEREKCRIKLRQAIARGEIERKPCVVCGDSNSHGHHEDYDKPLEVEWLCAKHHGNAHRSFNKKGLPKSRQEEGKNDSR